MPSGLRSACSRIATCSFGSGPVCRDLRRAISPAAGVHDGPCRGRGDSGGDGLRRGAGARFGSGPGRFPCVSIPPETPGSLPCMAFRETLRRCGKIRGRAGAARVSGRMLPPSPILSVSLSKPRPGAIGQFRPSNSQTDPALDCPLCLKKPTLAKPFW